MSDDLWINLEVNPEPWAVGPLFVGKRSGKFFPQMGRNQQVHSFKEAVKAALEDLPVTPKLDPDWTYDLEFFFWRRTEGYTDVETGRKGRAHVADATNMQKATEDALQGILFENDRDVHHVASWLMEQGPETTSRIVINASICSIGEAWNRLPEDVRYDIENPPQPRVHVDPNAWPPS